MLGLKIQSVAIRGNLLIRSTLHMARGRLGQALRESKIQFNGGAGQKNASIVHD
jgi:hypothetical protein